MTRNRHEFARRGFLQVGAVAVGIVAVDALRHEAPGAHLRRVARRRHLGARVRDHRRHRGRRRPVVAIRRVVGAGEGTVQPEGVAAAHGVVVALSQRRRRYDQ